MGGRVLFISFPVYSRYVFHEPIIELSLALTNAGFFVLLGIFAVRGSYNFITQNNHPFRNLSLGLIHILKILQISASIFL